MPVACVVRPVDDRLTRLAAFALSAFMLLALAVSVARAASKNPGVRFEISFPASARHEPIAGRVFVVISRTDHPEPRFQAGSWGDAPPLFGVDVDRLKPGKKAMIDGETLGYPTRSLRDVPAGDYYVQALVNVYTEFERSDGHTIWAHMDHWEGQQFNASPGNLYSDVEKVHLDAAAGYDVKLSLADVIPPVTIPADTPWVKHVRIESKLLTKFWGHPMYLGAVILLPKGYDDHPDVRYPVIYEQGHFSLGAPFGFSTEARPASDRVREGLDLLNRETRYKFAKAWTSDHFPRLIAVTFQHPTPYFDDSYAVNSANNGPYGDALLTELIPYVEEHFRVIRQPYARVLTGGSTGGWESLALQVFHPDFFGGTWTLYPDPVDFHRYGIVNIYDDENAFYEPGHHWLPALRYVERRPDGQPETSVADFSRLEAVLGSHGRSAQQLEAWEAVYGPAGDDGYPQPVWDKLTGQIDHSVANSMREHGYDLTDYLRRHWPDLGPKLRDKIHVDVGDMDSYYLNLAVYLLEDFLATTENPHDPGEFHYGRPMKPHGWEHATQENLIREMATYIIRHTPPGTDTREWNYK